jgi:hypothetical protein
MKGVFAAWGGIGFFVNFLILLALVFSREVGVGTSTWACAIALIWIGGTVFFGFGVLIFVRTDLADDIRITDRPT